MLPLHLLYYSSMAIGDSLKSAMWRHVSPISDINHTPLVEKRIFILTANNISTNANVSNTKDKLQRDNRPSCWLFIATKKQCILHYKNTRI